MLLNIKIGLNSGYYGVSLIHQNGCTQMNNSAKQMGSLEKKRERDDYSKVKPFRSFISVKKSKQFEALKGECQGA